MPGWVVLFEYPVRLPDRGVLETKITSIRIDSLVSEALGVVGVSHQRIFQRGLIAFGLEGQIRDPRILALAKRRQAELVEELTTEKLLLDELVRKMEVPVPVPPPEADKPLERWELKSLVRL